MSTDLYSRYISQALAKELSANPSGASWMLEATNYANSVEYWYEGIQYQLRMQAEVGKAFMNINSPLTKEQITYLEKMGFWAYNKPEDEQTHGIKESGFIYWGEPRL